MSSLSNIASRFTSAFSARIVSVVSGGILIYVLSQMLDPDAYGTLFLVISILGIIELFSRWGIARSTARYISEYKESDPGQVRAIIKTGFLLNLISIAVVVFILMLSYEYIAEILGESEIIPFLQFGILYIIFSTLSYFVQTILQGFENIKISSRFLIIEKLSRAVFALVFVGIGFGAIGALTGYIIAVFIVSIIGLPYLYFKKYKIYNASPVQQGLVDKVATYSFPLVITQGATVVDKQLDTVLVGFFLNPLSVAYYVLSRQIVQFIEAPLDALGFTLAPTFKSELSKGNKEFSSRLYNESITYSLALYIPAATGVILVSPVLIQTVFGEEYSGAIPVLQVLSLYIVIQSVTKLTTNTLDFLGRARERAIIKTVTAVLNVILNLVLIPILGVVGAAIATVITHTLYAVGNLFIISLELDLNMSGILVGLLKICVISIIMAVVVYPFAIIQGSLFSTILAIKLGIGTWVILSHKMNVIKFKKLRDLITY